MKAAPLPTIIEQALTLDEGAVPLVTQAENGETKTKQRKKRTPESYLPKNWDEGDSELLIALRALKWTWPRIRSEYFPQWSVPGINLKFLRLTKEPRLKARLEGMEKMEYSDRLKIVSRACLGSRRQCAGQEVAQHYLQQGAEHIAGNVEESRTNKVKDGDRVWEVSESSDPDMAKAIPGPAPVDATDSIPDGKEGEDTLGEGVDEDMQSVSPGENGQRLKAKSKGKDAAPQRPPKRHNRMGGPGEEEGK